MPPDSPECLTPFFKEEEFRCRCGCGLGYKDINQDSLSMLFKAREIAAVPFVIRSAVRCRAYNKYVGGKSDSSHIADGERKGYAFDIKAVGSGVRYRVITSLMEVGFNRFGIGQDFIHVDNDPRKVPSCIWHYYPLYKKEDIQ